VQKYVARAHQGEDLPGGYVGKIRGGQIFNPNGHFDFS
jgi:hypothetical protein